MIATEDILINQFNEGDEKSSPLAVLVHGRLGKLGIMSIFKNILPAGCSILSLQAPYEEKAGEFSWWDIRDEEGSIGQKYKSAHRILHTIGQVIQSNNLKPRAVYGIGFSQGAAMLSLAMQQQSSFFTDIAFLCGFVIKELSLLDQDLLALKERKEFSPSTRLFIYHGTEDHIIPFNIAEEGRDYLFSLGYQIKFVSEKTAHKIGKEGMRELKEWFKR